MKYFQAVFLLLAAAARSGSVAAKLAYNESLLQVGPMGSPGLRGQGLLRGKSKMDPPNPARSLNDVSGEDNFSDTIKIPTFEQELASREAQMGHLNKDNQVLVLHNLLLKAAYAKIGLQEALNLTGVDRHEMESLFEDHEDLAEDVVLAFEDVDHENAQLGENITRFLQERLVQQKDGTLLYVSTGPDPVEELQMHRRRLEDSRQGRWDKYHEQRALLPRKLKEHRDLLKRHLSSTDCDFPQDPGLCYSQDLESFETQLEELVYALEDELSPLLTMMDLLSNTVSKVKRAAKTIGTLVTIFNVLKGMPGIFGTVFGAALNIFKILDNGADPVEDTLDDFENKILDIWDDTAGKALDNMFDFEKDFGTAVSMFSIAAQAPYLPAVPEIVKGLFKINLQDFNDVVITVDKHIRGIMNLLQSLMKAFTSKVFATFQNVADGFIDAIGEVDVFMKAFDFVEKAYHHKITLPFGKPRTLRSRKYGRASCGHLKNRHRRGNHYPGYKVFEELGPWYVSCKEKCPLGSYDALAGDKICRKKCSANGLEPHKVLGMQDGCLRDSKTKPLKSLSFTKDCKKQKDMSGWYRTLRTDKCRPKCSAWEKAGDYYGETYKTCTMKCPKGMHAHKLYKDKACAIPDSQKFTRTKVSASCSAYTNNGQRDVYLKDTGGCYEDCKSNEHSYRGLFFCVDKEKLQISIKDIVDFISNVLDKISSLPGVGDIMAWIDKALESLFGFLEELIPDSIGFPNFNMDIDVKFLDFGAISDGFDKIKFPDFELNDVIEETVKSLAEKAADTPLAEAAKCGTDFDCIAAAMGFQPDKFEGVASFLEDAGEKLGALFEQSPSDLITCSGETTKLVPCSDVLSFLDLNDEDCTIPIPYCEHLDTTGLESAFTDLVDIFKSGRRGLGVGQDIERALADVITWAFPKGTYLPLFTLHVSPYFLFPSFTEKPTIRLRTNFHGDLYKPTQQIGFHTQIQMKFALSLGLYKSKCGVVKLGFEPSIATNFLFGFTRGRKKMLSKTIAIVKEFGGDYDRSSQELPWNKNPKCFPFLANYVDDSWGPRRNFFSSATSNALAGLELPSPSKCASYCEVDALGKDFLGKTGKCQGACQAAAKVGKANKRCTMTELEYLRDKAQLTPTEETFANRCIEDWFELRRDVLAGNAFTEHKTRTWGSWIWRSMTGFPISVGPPIWHCNFKNNEASCNDMLDEFYKGVQIGVGVVGYDTLTRTQIGPTVWFCPSCQNSAKPVATTLGILNPQQFRKGRHLKDVSYYLQASVKFSFGVITIGQNEVNTKNDKWKVVMEEGMFKVDSYCCGDEACPVGYSCQQSEVRNQCMISIP